MNAPVSLLARLIDDYIVWFAAWHRRAMGEHNTPPPPARFAQWHGEAIKYLTGEQPAVEHLSTLHEQLHKLVKLVLIKTPQGEPIAGADDQSIAEKYLELMRELRRFERAFALAASDLDPLTGLRTRQRLAQDLEREISRADRAGRPFFAVIMDIDHFKTINDTYGHEGGDRVLINVADHVSRNLRAHDDAYRLGGEEFFLCLKETDQTGSLRALERLRSGLEKMPIVLSSGQTIHVTASFGVTASTAALTPDTLLRKADEALYRAKKEGRNKVVSN